MRLIQFMNEAMVDLDVEDPNAAGQAAKLAARKAKMNPQRHEREQLQKARDAGKVAQSAEGPTAALEKQIATTKEKLARLNMKLQSMKK